MPKQPSSQTLSGRSSRGISPRTIGGLVLAVLVIIFIVLNRAQTDISFIFFTTRTALWVALTVAGVGGFVTGFLLGRQRYR